jgi:hypothetical protein
VSANLSQDEREVNRRRTESEVAAAGAARPTIPASTSRCRPKVRATGDARTSQTVHHGVTCRPIRVGFTQRQFAKPSHNGRNNQSLPQPPKGWGGVLMVRSLVG